MHHVVAQGNGRAAIVRGDRDRVDFLGRLAAACSESRWRCHAYCLLDTHAHLVVETPDPNLGAGMRALLSNYARSFHRRHATEGHVFRRPFYSRRITGESHFVAACLYVVLNPVAANLCSHPRDWRWSSYEETASGGSGLARVEALLGSYGDDPERSRAAYGRAVDAAAAAARTPGMSPLT